MPAKSLYKSDKGKVYTPKDFVKEYNKHPNLGKAEMVMGISAQRLSVIASRLRARGLSVKIHETSPRSARS